MTAVELIKVLNSIKRRYGGDTEIIIDMHDDTINEFIPLNFTEDKPNMTYAEGCMDEGCWVAKFNVELFDGCVE